MCFINYRSIILTWINYNYFFICWSRIYTFIFISRVHSFTIFFLIWRLFNNRSISYCINYIYRISFKCCITSLNIVISKIFSTIKNIRFFSWIIRISFFFIYILCWRINIFWITHLDIDIRCFLKDIRNGCNNSSWHIVTFIYFKIIITTIICLTICYYFFFLADK